jgi:hypothetical protein
MEGARSESFTQGSQLGNYARFMLPQLFEPWAAELVARARVRAGDHVLDVASGLAPVAAGGRGGSRRPGGGQRHQRPDARRRGGQGGPGVGADRAPRVPGECDRR